MSQLKTAVKEVLKKYNLLNAFKRLYRVCYYLQEALQVPGKIWRKFGGSSKKYNHLKKFKNINTGKRCFIVSTGPSLTLQDVNKLKAEYTFGMNSIIKFFGSTNWRPTYYGIQDDRVYEKLATEETFKNIENKFIASSLLNIIHDELNPIIFHLDPLDHLMPALKYTYKYSNDAYVAVYDGFTITFTLIQLATYMGFKEIYLLGCDCDYSGKKQHFVDYGVKSDVSAGDRMILAYQAAKEYADSHGIKIYNATRGGKLEVFERVDFDSLFPLEDSENNAPKTDK